MPTPEPHERPEEAGYQPGDRVRLPWEDGRLGTVVSRHDENPHVYRVRVDGKPAVGDFGDDEIERA